MYIKHLYSTLYIQNLAFFTCLYQFREMDKGGERSRFFQILYNPIIKLFRLYYFLNNFKYFLKF